TSDLSYFRFAREIADAMISVFLDKEAGGFFDTATADPKQETSLGILGTRRKPFQDSPTPAGNPVAAIALLRLHAYTNDPSYREQAQCTLEIFAGGADKYGMFAATYALAAVHLTQPHSQVVIVGNDDVANQLYRAALQSVSLTKAVVRFLPDAVLAQNLPPALSQTIPNLPSLREVRSFAVVCSGFSCQPHVFDPAELTEQLHSAAQPAA